MSVPTRVSWGGGFVVLAATLLFPPAADPADAELAALIAKSTLQDFKDIEVQARGPVHEAFAHPLEAKPEPGPAIAQQPPQQVPELPAEERPDGDNVQWIPGYWAWDADQNNFIWVSGVYRDAPPGRRYVPGYWVETPDGWRWVAGYWAPAELSEIPYAPEPPAPLDYGPLVAPPGDDYFYSPGYWSYRADRYYWRPGYWMPCRPGFVWIYPQWCWTPRGYSFVSGYWDYPLARRGLLFAPVCFNRPFWNTAGWAYRPRYAIGINTPWFSSFFAGPGRSYYFGDYYGSRYAGLGYRPWYSGSRYNDPLLSYYRWNHRNDPTWYSGVRQLALDRSAGLAPLPPRTFAQQAAALNKGNLNSLDRQGGRLPQNSGLQMVTPLNQFKTNNVKLARVDGAQFNAQKAGADRVRDLAQVRKSFETAAGTSIARRGERPALKLPSSFAPSSDSDRNFSSSSPLKPTINGNPGDKARSFGKSLNDATKPNDFGNRTFEPRRFSDFKTPPNVTNNAAPKLTSPVQPKTQTFAPPTNSTTPKLDSPGQFRRFDPSPSLPKGAQGGLTPNPPAPKTFSTPKSQTFTPSTPAPGSSAPRSFNPPPTSSPRSLSPPSSSFSPPANSAPRSFSPPPTSQPRSFSPPATSAPKSFSPPPTSPSPKSFTPPSASFSPPANSAPRSFSPPPTSQPRSFSPPATSAPKSFSPPANSAPRSFNPPPTSQPRSFSPPATSVPKSFSPPANSAPRSFSPPPTSAPKSFSPPSSSSRSFSPPPSSTPRSFSPPSSSSRSFSPPSNSSSGSRFSGSSSRSVSPPSSGGSSRSSSPPSGGGGRKR